MTTTNPNQGRKARLLAVIDSIRPVSATGALLPTPVQKVKTRYISKSYRGRVYMIPELPDELVLKPRAAAKKLGVSPKFLLQLLEEGRLEGTKIDNSWGISPYLVQMLNSMVPNT